MKNQFELINNGFNTGIVERINTIIDELEMQHMSNPEDKAAYELKIIITNKEV